MVDWDLAKERLRAYRRNLANTWALFKESRIGVVGIGIMIVFVILAALAPYLGLRDPIYWRAPSEDVIALDTYWQADTSSFLFRAGDPIQSQVAIRVIPRATDPRADRLYAASGNKLLAINPAAGGSKGWTGPDQTAAFTTPTEITAGPVAVNFGSKTNPAYLDLVVYLGTSDGTFYALNDSAVEFDGDTPLPGGPDVTTRSVVGSVTSIAVWSEPTDDPAPARHLGESVFVGTSEGHLYAFAASNLSLIWEQSFGPGIPIRMASGPMNPPANPSYSPALTEDGQQLFLNAGDWQSVYTRNGTLAWTGFPVSTPWTSAPVVGLPSILADGSFGELAYAASDDGWLFARKIATGAPYAPWETSAAAQLHPSGSRTIPVMETVSQRDPGPLSSPFIDSTTVYVTSGSGILYSIGKYLAPLPPGTYPSGNQYLWGTDLQGRDIFSQFIWGSRIALIVGFSVALLTVGIGLVVGLVAGYLGRKTDIVLMRFTDVILVLPLLPLLIILAAVLGSSIWNIILVIALLSWPGTARVIRSEVLSLKERPYIQSARVTGASSVRIMFRHLTPNVMPLVFLYMTFAVSGAILLEAALSFIGLGDPNTPSWGQMLSTVQQADLLRAYWWLLPPRLGITVLALAFFLTGRAFEQIINPRLRTR